MASRPTRPPPPPWWRRSQRPRRHSGPGRPGIVAAGQRGDPGAFAMHGPAVLVAIQAEPTRGDLRPVRSGQQPALAMAPNASQTTATIHSGIAWWPLDEVGDIVAR